jgi:hypothetical protein
MKGLTDLLYAVSTFHDNFKTRGFKMPERFAFSKGANDVKAKKGKGAVPLTQDTAEQVRSPALIALSFLCASLRAAHTCHVVVPPCCAATGAY